MSLCSSKVSHLSGSFVIDESQFCELFSFASPWGVGCLAAALASRIFTVGTWQLNGLVNQTVSFYLKQLLYFRVSGIVAITLPF